ncbi:class I SAM-dependent methyltransferase [Mesorhizobium sp. SB112]|uniref:class I SAM-dependent methyltransferase n=1 Tax=Mesorhizobium sp. SB112 TaxID=3151853 RepID=UPI00326667A4
MQGTDGYGENAKALAVQYESIGFSDVHRDVLHLFPSEPSRILDIGAGSGRDAAALTARGHKVTAVEPTAALRAEGQRLHASASIEWIDDILPDLSVVGGRVFDVIMLTAVWMHLDEAERRTAMTHLAQMLVLGGIIIMSLRHGPVPAGRKMFDVSATETIALAQTQRLSCIHHNEREDMLGRDDVSWSFLGLKSGQG